MQHYEFTLYVSRRRGGGLREIASVEKACRRHLRDDYSLKIIDVDDSPEEVEQWHVLATPTLVVEQPLPQRRVTGCFDHAEQLARAMGIVDVEPSLPDAADE
jgi:circadian clock protein KaiB